MRELIASGEVEREPPAPSLGPQYTDTERLNWIQFHHRNPWICDRSPNGYTYNPPRFALDGPKTFLSVRDAIDNAMDMEDRQRQTEGAPQHAGGKP